MKTSLIEAILVLGVLTILIAATELNHPGGDCEIFKLGSINNEGWSSAVSFSDEITAYLRSSRKRKKEGGEEEVEGNEWRQFSFGFESGVQNPIGFLRFQRESNNMTLTLKNWDPSNTEDEEEVLQPPKEFQDKLIMKNWTVISLQKSKGILTVTVDVTSEITFHRVNMAAFQFVYAYVPQDQYIEVGFNCKTSVAENEGDQPLTGGTHQHTGTSHPSQSSSSGFTAVIVILLLVILVAAAGGGYWYFKKKKREKRQHGYLSSVYGPNKTGDKTNEGRKDPVEVEGTVLLDKVLSSNQRQECDLGISTLFSKEQDEREALVPKGKNSSEQEQRSTPSKDEVDTGDLTLAEPNDHDSRDRHCHSINSGKSSENLDDEMIETNATAIKNQQIPEKIIQITQENYLTEDRHKNNDKTEASTFSILSSEQNTPIEGPIREETPAFVTQMSNQITESCIENVVDAISMLSLRDKDNENSENVGGSDPQLSQNTLRDTEKVVVISETKENTLGKKQGFNDRSATQGKVENGSQSSSEKTDDDLPYSQLLSEKEQPNDVRQETNTNDISDQGMLELENQIVPKRLNQNNSDKPTAIVESSKNLDAYEMLKSHQMNELFNNPREDRWKGKQDSEEKASAQNKREGRTVKDYDTNVTLSQSDELQNSCDKEKLKVVDSRERTANKHEDATQINVLGEVPGVVEEPCIKIALVKSGETEGTQPKRVQEIQKELLFSEYAGGGRSKGTTPYGKHTQTFKEKSSSRNRDARREGLHMYQHYKASE